MTNQIIKNSKNSKWGYDNPIYSPKSQHPFQLYTGMDQQSDLSSDDYWLVMLQHASEYLILKFYKQL